MLGGNPPSCFNFLLAPPARPVGSRRSQEDQGEPGGARRARKTQRSQEGHEDQEEPGGPRRPSGNREARETRKSGAPRSHPGSTKKAWVRTSTRTSRTSLAQQAPCAFVTFSSLTRAGQTRSIYLIHVKGSQGNPGSQEPPGCLLYTSDAADE